MRCQSVAMNTLKELASRKMHSVLIQGVPGSGKTYLASKYATMLGVEDFCLITPTVADVRESLDACTQFDHPVVLCIENLDCGVAAASYALLKSLEEPRDDLYIVVTCRNLYGIPDTIRSRSSLVITNPPTAADIEEYSVIQNSSRYGEVKRTDVWKCVRTFTDANSVLMMSKADFEYIEGFRVFLTFKDTISNLAWKVGHYDDNRETPVELMVRYIMSQFPNDQHIQRAGVSCLIDIGSGRIASHAAVARFLLECKYCE